jgi:hypothetical protein
MRQTMVGLAVALAVAVSAVPAVACGYSGCSSPSWNYNYSGFYGNYSAPVAPCPTACGGYAAQTSWGYGRLPYPAQPYATLPQYYWVNQGPTYTGPGMFAPAPTYQERAVSGWSGYGPTAYGTTNYSYGGGPYSNATTHYYDGMPAAGYSGYSYQSYSDLPRTYSDQGDEDVQAPVYRPYYARPMYHYARPYRRMIAPRYYRSMRYGYAPHFRRYVGVSRYAMPPRYMAHRYAPRFMAPRYVAPYGRPRMSLRYGVPRPMVRQGYVPRMGYAPMPPRRMYRPMYN